MGTEWSVSRTALFEKWISDVKDPKIVDYIRTRVMGQMEWFGKESTKNKKKYQGWMLASVIVSSLIPVASVFADGSIGVKILIAALGSMVTAITAFLRLQDYQDQWSNYRYNREYLMSTLYSYFTNTGVFAQFADQAARDRMLIDTCENFIHTDAEGWRGCLAKSQTQR